MVRMTGFLLLISLGVVACKARSNKDSEVKEFEDKAGSCKIFAPGTRISLRSPSKKIIQFEQLTNESIPTEVDRKANQAALNPPDSQQDAKVYGIQGNLNKNLIAGTTYTINSCTRPTKTGVTFSVTRVNFIVTPQDGKSGNVIKIEYYGNYNVNLENVLSEYFSIQGQRSYDTVDPYPDLN